MVNFRKAKEKDKEFIYSLTKKNMKNYFEKFLPEGWSDEKFWKGLDLERIFILEEEKNQVGFLDLENKSDFLYVHNTQVNESFVGSGIFIRKKIEEEASKKGYKKIRGKVFQDNLRALKLFDYWGYKIDEKEDLSFENSFWIEKNLN